LERTYGDVKNGEMRARKRNVSFGNEGGGDQGRGAKKSPNLAGSECGKAGH